MRRWVLAIAVLVILNLVIGACASAPTPSQAPTTAPTKAAESTKAPESTKVAEPTKATAPSATKVEFPTRPITIWLGQAPGGTNDIQARPLAEAMSKLLGVPVTVESIPGANGAVMLDRFARAKADGYIIAQTNLPGVQKYLMKDSGVSFGREDFVPLARVATGVDAFTVLANSPYQSMNDLIEASKSGKRITVGIPGIHGLAWFALRQIEDMTGAKFADVYFESGGEALTALLGGKVDVAYRGLEATVPTMKKGTVRILGFAGDQRYPGAPEIPTLKEQGIPLYWPESRGYAVPKGTPKEVVDILAKAIEEACIGKGPNGVWFQEQMAKLGFTISFMGPKEYAAEWDRVDQVMSKILADQGLLAK